MPTAMVTFNGRITLPPQVRKDLGLEIGDSVDFVEIEKGRFAIHTCAGSNLDQDCCSSKESHQSVSTETERSVQ